MSILIVGDSFSASESTSSWTNLLGCPITNISSNGSSEYRILKKILSKKLDHYDAVIVTHTSPNRIYVDYNPTHLDTIGYRDCDLIYSDVKDKQTEFAKNASWYFENVFDLEQANLVHRLMIDKIIQLTQPVKNIHVSFFDFGYPGLINLHHIWKQCPGDVNHLNLNGNIKVANIIKELL